MPTKARTANSAMRTKRSPIGKCRSSYINIAGDAASGLLQRPRFFQHF
jgi:hypothetical protein